MLSWNKSFLEFEFNYIIYVKSLWEVTKKASQLTTALAKRFLNDIIHSQLCDINFLVRSLHCNFVHLKTSSAKVNGISQHGVKVGPGLHDPGSPQRVKVGSETT